MRKLRKLLTDISSFMQISLKNYENHDKLDQLFVTLKPGTDMQELSKSKPMYFSYYKDLCQHK